MGYFFLQAFAANKLDAMSKMWVSFIGIGLMIAAALIITFARTKTKGLIRVILTIVAIIMLLYGMICGLLALV